MKLKCIVFLAYAVICNAQSQTAVISANPDLTSVNYNPVNITKPETVIESIKKYLESIN